MAFYNSWDFLGSGFQGSCVGTDAAACVMWVCGSGDISIWETAVLRKAYGYGHEACVLKCLFTLFSLANAVSRRHEMIGQVLRQASDKRPLGPNEPSGLISGVGVGLSFSHSTPTAAFRKTQCFPCLLPTLAATPGLALLFRIWVPVLSPDCAFSYRGFQHLSTKTSRKTLKTL